MQQITPTMIAIKTATPPAMIAIRTLFSPLSDGFGIGVGVGVGGVGVGVGTGVGGAGLFLKSTTKVASNLVLLSRS